MLFSSYTYKMKFKFIALFEHIATRSPHGIKISFFEYLLWLFGLNNMFFGSIDDRLPALEKGVEDSWTDDFFFEGCKRY